jgi:cytochrome P450
MLFFLFIADMHTTSEFIGNAIYLLLTEGDVWDRVTADRVGLLSKYVEEALRLLPPMRIRLRLVSRDVDLAGTSIKKGDAGCTLNAAANRDPDHYPCPHAVDVTRTPITGHLVVCQANFKQ